MSIQAALYHSRRRRRLQLQPRVVTTPGHFPAASFGRCHVVSDGTGTANQLVTLPTNAPDNHLIVVEFVAKRNVVDTINVGGVAILTGEGDALTLQYAVGGWFMV